MLAERVPCKTAVEGKGDLSRVTRAGGGDKDCVNEGVGKPVVSATESILHVCCGVMGEKTGASGDALTNDSKCPKLISSQLICS